MGAQYIDGNKNPLYDLAENLGVIDHSIEDFEHLDVSTIRYGNCPIQKSDINAYLKFITPLDKKYQYIADNDETKSYDETVKSMYDKDYTKFLIIQNATMGFRRNVFDSLTRLYQSQFEFEYAAKWEDLSLRAMTDWDDLGGDGASYSTTKIGYTAILSYLTSKIPSSKIHLNHRISHINYLGEKTKLMLTTGTLINDDFDYVIVTSALGHLKKFAHKMFTPQLPKRIMNAIEKIGMGTSSKIFLVYSDSTWMDTFLSPLPVPDCFGRKGIESEFNTFQKVPWAPNIYMGWIAGDAPEKVDKLSDQELSKILTQLFRDIYRNYSIPEPSTILRQKWTQNDLYGGSYSYVSYEQAQAGIRHSDLSIPIIKNGKIRIQFAGEATHDRIFQTAVGAFLSGRRESDRILNDLKK
uniref:Amine oxidase domain-containing protein n=1 Tax=Panagrolaimus sp. PS1159 TaxID=55785 RepID=A0AC35GFI3_9BILA